MKTYPVKKNETIEVEIIDLTHEGLGVGKVDGYPLFIENSLPGEKVRALVLKVGNKFGYGKVIERLNDSPDRVELTDESLLRTGIAPLQHMTYEAQLLFKQKQVENVLNKISKMPDVPVLPSVGMANPVGYRNKAQIPVRKVNRELETGFYRKNSHDLVPITDFYIQDPVIDQAIVTIRDIMRRFSVKPYDEAEHTGNLRQIIIRRGHYSHQMMVVLVTRTEKLFKHEQIVEVILKELPEVVSIIHNINPDKTNVILGKESKVLYGQNYIEDQLLGKTYRISAPSFYQVNTEQTEYLYQTAMDFAGLTKDDIVIDAYCGIGTIGLSLADRVKHVYGVEIVKDAIEDATINAFHNEIDNVTFKAGSAENLMKQWKDSGIDPTVLVVDPPRKGLTPSFIETAMEMAPERIVYISCNPATLARDLKLFGEQYEVKKIQPVDLFPQTAHVEAVALLQKR
ncbi:23S rRNA (uracil(1939)-C(5))-methyltransferase RlmD [Candidatus Enterococcus clewellii]|uniref:23S rRNA (Uracil-5-)-methyltransferase RumA n=1 Tax=Candidatus Enterococcus clewellii TaxID=1834193 RepID=A0A242K6C1_9ENTE|nr:23S rRNA (uracil(1939)-C(5))-methyltransferase RlmD [Enterococcus sp. 9E7_DIV0242]OTP15754.1 23S rRNA (uracil-5-)-methyltransferase RumA [Enterococcus sp. 9E7_DIV0242]